jgi:hypothetical protein
VERQCASAAREASEGIRRDLEENISRLETALGERLHSRTLPSSAHMNRINNLLEDLSAEDIVEDAGGRTTRLGVRAETLKRAVGLMRQLVDEDFHTDLKELQQKLQETAEAVNHRLAAVADQGQPRGIPAVEETALWNGLQQKVQLDFHYQSEAQRHGWLDLFMHGRRPVIMATMMISMFGAAFGIGSHLGLVLAPLLLVLFLGSLGWATYEFRQEHHERIDRELRRLREALGTELKRLYEQVQREWQGRLTRHLRQAYKNLSVHADDRLRGWEQEQTRAAEHERQELQEKQKTIELRIRELGAMQQQAQRAGQAAAEARQALESTTAVILDRWRAGR